LAGSDRIARDAVGLSILKELGSNRDIMGRKIFEQEQISRASEKFIFSHAHRMKLCLLYGLQMIFLPMEL